MVRRIGPVTLEVKVVRPLLAGFRVWLACRLVALANAVLPSFEIEVR